MSVIVKGMEMPRTCAECKMWSLCWVSIPAHNMIKSSCPLIEVQSPHGRLTDADKLLKDHGLKLTEEFAPTVIEAEGSDT